VSNDQMIDTRQSNTGNPSDGFKVADRTFSPVRCRRKHRWGGTISPEPDNIVTIDSLFKIYTGHLMVSTVAKHTLQAHAPTPRPHSCCLLRPIGKGQQATAAN